MFDCEGSSNIVSSKISSNIDLSPLAPVFLTKAFLAIADNESFVKVSFAPSISKSLAYCLRSAFFGSCKILIRASSCKSS